MTVGILGGGISGIALHRALRRDSEILEAAETAGGLHRTFRQGDFAYDIGGHILFSKHEHVTDLVNALLGDNINHCKRLNTILYKGRYVKYPFENDLYALAPEDRAECLIEYLKADFPKPTNLEEWAYYTFGRGIAEKYLIPYNQKIWKTLPSKLSLEWVERIPKPPMEDVVKSAVGVSTEGYTHQLYFRYPMNGGAEALVHALLGDEPHIELGAPVSSIRRDGDAWHVVAGKLERRYEEVVCAFPIHEALRCFDEVPAEVEAAVKGLRYNAVRVVLVAVDDESLMDRSAIYIPDPRVLPHRVCYMGFFSPNNVRPGTSSLVAEITTPPGGPIDQMSDRELVSRTLEDLDRAGIIEKTRVIETDTRRFEYAYPVYDLDYSRNTAVFRSWFEEQGVHLLGRFAEFDYINSDECIRRALLLAEELDGEG